MAEFDRRAALTADDGNDLRPAGSIADLERVEASLSVVLPADLRDLYRVSNGMFDKPGEWFVVRPVDASKVGKTSLVEARTRRRLMVCVVSRAEAEERAATA